MNKLLKKISAILTIIMLMLAIPSGTSVFAAEETDSYSLSAEQEGLLRYLGIIDNSAIDYNEQITRGELAHIAAGFAKVRDNVVDKNYFYDVTSDYKYANDINALAQIGILSGNGYGYFQPDAYVGDAEICKVFATLLGYRQTGHYGSYVGVAHSAGIIDGVKMDNVVTYGDVLEIVYNSLHCSIVEVFLLSGGVSYSVNEGYLAVEYYHGLIMQEGIVEGIDGTELTKVNDSIEEGKVMIDGRIYNCDSADELLGQSVVFYNARKTNSKEADDDILYIHANERNDILTIYSDDINVSKTNYSAISYYVNNKEKTVKLDVPDVIINGMAYPEYEISDLVSGASKLTLINNDIDSEYDVILVESYKYVLVDSIDIEKGLVFAKRDADGNEVVLGDSTREEVRLTVSDNGRKIMPSTVRDGAPVAVKISKNTEGILKINVQPLSVKKEGIVTSISDEYITIDGTKYKLTVKDALVDDGYKVAANNSVKIYTHLDRCVVITHSAENTYVEGFLIGADKDEAAFSETLKLRILDRNRTMIDYECKERLVIDNEGYKDVDTILSKLSEGATAAGTATDTRPHYQLVRYKVDETGKITHLDTARTGVKLTGDELDAQTAGSRLGGSGLFYMAGDRSFYNTADGENQEMAFTLSSSASAWSIPSTDAVRDIPEYYYVANIAGGFAGSTAYGYSADPGTKIAQYMVAYHPYDESTTVDVNNSLPSFVMGKAEVLDDKGEVVVQLEVISTNGTVTTLTLDDKIRDIDVEIGDLIHYWLRPMGDLTTAITVKKLDNLKYSRTVFNGSKTYPGIVKSYYYSYFYGTAISIQDGFITHTTTMPEDDGGVVTDSGFNNYLITASTTFYVYDENDRYSKFMAGGQGDIDTFSKDPENPDEVFLICQSGTLKSVYIIKK